MANEIQLDVDDFLQDLATSVEADNQKSNSGGARYIKKVWCNARTNQGKYYFVPLSEDAPRAKVLRFVEGVREVKLSNPKMENTDPRWFRFLPYEAYRFDPAKDSRNIAMYNHAISLFDAMMKDQVLDRTRLRTNKKYMFTYAYVINAINPKGDSMMDGLKLSENKLAFLIFPSAAMKAKVLSAIETRSQTMGGDKTWINKYFFNNDLDNRKGYVIVNFVLGQMGYDVEVSFEFNNEFSKVSPEKLELTDSDLDDRTAHYKEFLGWQSGEVNLFNPDVFQVAIEQMTSIMTNPAMYPNGNCHSVQSLAPPAELIENVVTQQAPQPAQQELVANKETDPMLAGNTQVSINPPLSEAEVQTPTPPVPPAPPTPPVA